MIFKYLISFILVTFLPILYILRFLRKVFYHQDNILLGIQPLISNKYWSNALNMMGLRSKSVVIGTFVINQTDDFDYVINTRLKFLKWIVTYLLFYDILILSFRGGFIGKLPIGRFEPIILKIFKIKTIILGYGSDIHLYDRINQCSYIHTLNSFYPQSSKNRVPIIRATESWQKHASFLATAMFFGNGFYRNDILTPNFLFFPVENIVPKYNYKRNSPIYIVHSPNHRIIKGTEYINHIVEKLQSEFNIEYILLEKKPNQEVLNILQNKATIFIEKLVGPSYALSAIEAMSYGVPVIGSVNNGDWDDLYKSFSRYSFLEECPIVSASIETLESVLRNLCSSPDKLNHLSRKSRRYVERYHSYKSGGIFFNEIFRLLKKERADLKNFYHPLIGEYRKFDC